MLILTEDLVTFTEMDVNADTPEITTACWSILNKNPDDVMCSHTRMVVKEKKQKTKCYCLHVASL